MAGPRNDSTGRGYHHGDLKEALVNAAIWLIEHKGPEGFTLAEAARWAGVSPAAPYRHFRDREDLLSKVAQRGFALFEADLLAAWNDGRPNPLKAFEHLGRAYLAFAKSKPAFYFAMFEAAIPLDNDEELRKANDRVFAILRNVAASLAASLPPSSRPPALMMASHFWALTHGVAALFGRGDRARRALPMSAEDLWEAANLIYCDGLGLRGPRKSPPRP
jgi:AcrR family transcriptional regulator